MISKKKKSTHGRITQSTMKNRPSKNVLSINTIEKQLKNYCQDLNDTGDEIRINPLPTPAFMHFDASNTATPRFKFTPSLRPSVHRRARSEYMN